MLLEHKITGFVAEEACSAVDSAINAGVRFEDFIEYVKREWVCCLRDKAANIEDGD